MFKLKYTGDRSYTGYGVSVSANAPFVEVDDQDVVDCLVASKRFSLVEEADSGDDSESEKPPGTPASGQTPNAIPEGDPGETWTVAQLKAYASENGIDLGKSTAKPDILAKIQEAESGLDFSQNV